MCVLYECVGCGVMFLLVSLNTSLSGWLHYYANNFIHFASTLSFFLTPLPPPPPPLSWMYPELSQESGIKCDDLVSTMQYYGLLKYWKGKHIVLRRKVCILYIGLCSNYSHCVYCIGGGDPIIIVMCLSFV